MSNEHVIKSDKYSTIKLYEGPHYLNVIIDAREESHPSSFDPNALISSSLYDEDLPKLYAVVRKHMIDRGLITEPTDTTWEAVHANLGKSVHVSLTSGVYQEGEIKYANSAHVAITRADVTTIIPWQVVQYIKIEED